MNVQLFTLKKASKKHFENREIFRHNFKLCHRPFTMHRHTRFHLHRQYFKIKALDAAKMSAFTIYRYSRN